MEDLLFSKYGSHLYGTATLKSDFDNKVVYLPEFNSVLLGKKLQTFKWRKDSTGAFVPDGVPMPDNGTETEYVPFQTFCRDFLNGQTYALEVAFACYGDVGYGDMWLKELVDRFLTCNVASMAGFAMKQTFDYVHRGRRLEAARRVLEVLTKHMLLLEELENQVPGSYMKQRLDSVLPDGTKVLHSVARMADLELGTSVNHNRTLETLKLNGREYLETTDLKQLELAVAKLIGEYGDRSNRAAEVSVDTKSLSHAVRVYEQALELLTMGKLTFPRVNAPYLLAVKEGRIEPEEVKIRLLELEEQVTDAQNHSLLLQAKTPQLEAEFEAWLLGWLKELYGVR